MRIALSAPIDIHSLARARGRDAAGIAPGLGSTATTPLAIELLRRGHEVTIYTLSQGLPAEEIYRWGALTIYVGPCRNRHLARNFYSPEIAYLTRVIKADAPSFVHAHWTYEFALGALLSGVETVTTIHDLPWNVLRYYRDPHRVIRLLMAYGVALWGKRFTAVSEDAASHFRRYFRPGADITVIHNGLPCKFFSVEPSSRPDVGGACVFATVLQGWSRRKNAVAALKAFAIVRRTLPHARLLMFGGDYEPGGPAHRWALTNGFETGVGFAGSVPYAELLRRLRAEIDIVVHPSLDESFSMATVEGMASRKPVIAGKSTPGVREVLDFGRGGILVDVRDPEKIAEAMIRLANDEGYRQSIAQKGYNRAFSLYQMEFVVSKYEEFYRSLVPAQAIASPA